MALHPKSCELDPIPAHLFRKGFQYIIEFLTFLFNKSMTLGEFPETWKCAVLRPLIKGTNLPTVNANYRPVSNLSFISKVLEKLVLGQLMDHCSAHELLPLHQSAYHPNHSCETVLMKLMDDILWNMERNQTTAALFLDLSAAFDTVDHDILHQTLDRTYQIKGQCLHWFDSYLQPRMCKMSIGSAYSLVQTMDYLYHRAPAWDQPYSQCMLAHWHPSSQDQIISMVMQMTIQSPGPSTSQNQVRKN